MRQTKHPMLEETLVSLARALGEGQAEHCLRASAWFARRVLLRGLFVRYDIVALKKQEAMQMYMNMLEVQASKLGRSSLS